MTKLLEQPMTKAQALLPEMQDAMERGGFAADAEVPAVFSKYRL